MDGRGNVEMFTSVTGASEQVAAKYLQDAKGDIDMAIALFFSEQEPGGAAAPDGAPAAAAGSGPSGSQAAVDSILEDAKARADQGASGEAGGSAGAGAGAGKGSGKGGVGGPEHSVFIVFFSDGFMVDDDFEFSNSKPEPEAEKPAAAPARRTGMMSLNDLKKDPKSRGPLPKLPKLKPLRSYDTPENKAFLDDVKAGRLPPELRKRDENGAPIQVGIAIEDVRPKSYEELAKVIKQMEGMQKEMEGEQGGGSKPSGPALFAGAGNTLSGSSSSAAPAAGAGGGGGGGGAGADPSLVALVSAGPPPQADESRPVASIQIRLSTGARVKARLNLEHTVADLWRLVAAEMGADAFRAASGHQLVAGFPPRPLADPGATLAAADLANAAVTHRCQ